MPPAYFPLRWESTGDQWWFVSPIDWAAANGHYDLVRELLHLDTNLLIKLTSLRRIHRLEIVWDDEGKFPDVAKCRAEVAKKLLLECETNKGYNTLIRAGYGGWLLYTAASAGDVDFVRHLLDGDPRLVFGEGEYGVTDILYAAARSKNSKVFRVILDFALSPWGDGSSVGEIEEKEHEGYLDFGSEIMNRAVHAAARGGNLEFLKEILEDDSDVLVHKDDQGSNILHSASARGQVEVVKYLLATSCEIIKTKYNQGNTALHICAYKGHLAVVEILLSASPSLAQETNDHGDTFLHMAIAGFHAPGFRRLDQQMALMKELLRCKFVNLQDIINARNNDGRTALHMAVTEHVQSDIVELLMSAPSINLNVRDAEGNTALDLLKQRPRSASSQILIKQLIAAGGVSNCKDHTTRKAIASNLKMQGIGGSPGTSFRTPDAEIFLHTSIDNDSDGSCKIASTRFTACSGHLSICSGPPSIDSSKSNSVNKTRRRLKMLLHWRKKKERKECTAGDTGEDSSIASYSICTKLENNPIPLRQRFSRGSFSLPNNKRLSAQPDLPSPSSKKRFAAGLMQGVIQLMPRTSFETPSSPFSGSSLASPMSVRKVVNLS